jgi:hypothetical protein
MTVQIFPVGQCNQIAALCNKLLKMRSAQSHKQRLKLLSLAALMLAFTQLAK